MVSRYKASIQHTLRGSGDTPKELLRRAKAAYFFYGAQPADDAMMLQGRLGTRDGEPPDAAAVQIQANIRRAAAVRQADELREARGAAVEADAACEADAAGEAGAAAQYRGADESLSLVVRTVRIPPGCSSFFSVLSSSSFVSSPLLPPSSSL